MNEILSQEGYVVVGLIFFGPSLIVLSIAGLLRVPELFRRLQRSRRRRRQAAGSPYHNTATLRAK